MKLIFGSGKMLLLLAVLLSFFVLIPNPGAMAQDDVARHPNCPYCGMDRAKFAHSRFYIEYDDATAVGFCSLHCAAMDMAVKIDKTPKALMVGDYNSKKLIDAEKAYWVIGGDKMGVMTVRAKWAFKSKADADAFIKTHGGKPATFDDAVRATFEDMHDDVQMIRKKRKMMRMKKKKTGS
ncbi:nitrous oxide reductase accessory protein NosL [Thermodesulfobacteriota bacterium]